MSTINIIGNVTRDTYITLDSHQSTIEKGRYDTPWLTAPFDDSHSLKYFNEITTLGGSAITQDIFSIFGHEPAIINDPTMDDEPDLTDRYILTVDNHALHLFPTTPKQTIFTAPVNPPDYLYIGRSANLDITAVTSIINYLHIHQNVKLILFISKRTNPSGRPYENDLLARSDLIISDIEFNTERPILYIGKNILSYGSLSVPLSLTPKNRLMTTLSSHSLIAAAFAASMISGHGPKQALLFAKATIEHSTLIASPSYNKLKDIIMDQDYLIQNDTSKPNAIPEVELTVERLMVPGKGILAADESGGSIKKKFEAAGIPDEEEVRRTYRNIFFTTPGISEYLTGIILFDETARQKSDDGRTFPQFISDLGIIPGIKVDLGLEPIPESPDENYTKGLDTLGDRLAEYYDMGARFAKWRAAFNVTNSTPSELAIDKNCEILAEYAKICQEHNIVPIVEPEVVHDGDYTIRASAEITSKILNKLFEQLEQRSVNLKGCILKVNMCLAGSRYEIQSSAAEVGRVTAEVLKAIVPDKLAGVVFLSGGQEVEQSTNNLAEIIKNGPFPWYVTFSFARALQDPVIDTLKNIPENIPVAQGAFLERLKANQLALGHQEPGKE